MATKTEKAAVEAVETPFVEDMDIPVSIRLNRLEDEGSGKVDQTVNVTRNGETLVIQRGEHIQIPKWAFIQLVQSGRFPEI